MSRFFHGGDSDSESSSSDEEELYEREEAESEEEESDLEDEDDEDDSSSDESVEGVGASRFLKPSAGGEDSDDSDEDEGERVVKSAKDKRLDEIQQTISKIENAQKNQDWSIISAGKHNKIDGNWEHWLIVYRIRQPESSSTKSHPAGWHTKDLCQNHCRP